MKQFYINGVGSSTYGVYISSDTFLNSPSFDFTEYSVPARNGSLIAYNQRLNNVLRKFDCYINTNVLSNLNGLKRLLYSHPGYVRIESDYDPDTYQEGYLAQEIEVAPFDASGVLSVQFSLFFSCKPQKFFKTTQETTIETYYSQLFLLPRTNKKIATMLELLTPSQIPEDMLFYGLRMSSGTKANFNASWSGGADFFALVDAYYDPYTKTKSVLYTNNTSITSQSVTATENCWLIFGYRDSGNLVYSYTGSSQQTLSLNSGKVDITNSNATGVSVDTVKVTMENTANVGTLPSYLVVTKLLNNEKVGSLLLTINNSAGAWNDYYYEVDGALRVDLEFDLNLLECHAVKSGLAPLNVSNIVNIEGSADGVCDTISVQNIWADGYIHILESSVEPRWWKL